MAESAATVVGLWLLDEADRIANAAIEQLAARLAPAEQVRLAALAAAHRRREFVLGRALARTALWRTLGRLSWLDGEVGHRPYARCADGLRHPGVNLSHSRDVLVCAATVEPRKIGCDVERWRPRSAASWQRLARATLAHPVFSGAERAALVALPGAARDGVFQAAWTVKEAIGKARGTGIYRGDLVAHALDIATLAEWCDGTLPALSLRLATDWSVVVLRRTDAWLSVAREGEPFSVAVTRVTLADLLQAMQRVE